MFFERIFIFPFLKSNLFKKHSQAKSLIPGSYLVTSCLNAAFYLSHNIRRDTIVFLLFKEEDVGILCLKFVGKNLKRFQPDEHSILGLIRNSIIKFRNLVNTYEKSKEKIQVYPGLFVFRISFFGLLSKLKDAGYQILYPSIGGVDVRNIRFLQKIAYVTSSESLIDEVSQKIVHRNGIGIHFGNTLPRTDIQIILLHNELDRAEKRLSNSL